MLESIDRKAEKKCKEEGRKSVSITTHLPKI